MKEHIAEIIEGCRCKDELLIFTDCTTAAKLILEYLERENRLVNDEIELLAA